MTLRILWRQWYIHFSNVLLTVHRDISLQYEPTGCTIYFQFISVINRYMFRAILRLIISRYYSVYTPPMPPHVLMNFRGFPPGCGDSVADFWGWDAHEARLRCPDDVSGDMQGDEIPGGALNLNLLTTQTMVTTGIFPCKEKFPW